MALSVNKLHHVNTFSFISRWFPSELGDQLNFLSSQAKIKDPGIYVQEKKKEKIIAIKDSDCSITRRPKNLQQLIHQNYTGLPGCTPVFDNGGGGGEFGGASASIARLHTWHRGCLSGTCPTRNGNFVIYMGNISKNLDQAMS